MSMQERKDERDEALRQIGEAYDAFQNGDGSEASYHKYHEVLDSFKSRGIVDTSTIVEHFAASRPIRSYEKRRRGCNLLARLRRK